MTVLCYKCCFWFSLRLGSIICAVLGILKAVCSLTVVIVLFQQDAMKEIIEKARLYTITESIVDLTAKEILVFFIVFNCFMAVYILSCVSLIVGAILCKPSLCYPFLAANSIWVMFDIINYVVLFKYLMSLTFIPPEELHTSLFGLGNVIVYLTIVLLYIFFEMYIGLCVHSFTQLIKTLRKELSTKKFAPVMKLTFKSGQLEEVNMQKNGGYYS